VHTLQCDIFFSLTELLVATHQRRTLWLEKLERARSCNFPTSDRLLQFFDRGDFSLLKVSISLQIPFSKMMISSARFGIFEGKFFDG